MITKIMTVEELKGIFAETLLNKTNKISKVSEGSVVNGISYGSGKLAQKVLKDIAVIEAHLFADSAYGVYLDRKASLDGVAPRQLAIGSSTFVRIVADPGTVYTQGLNQFTGNNGILFDLDSTVTVGSIGFTYASVHSVSTGANTNVEPLSITKVNPTPVGHNYVINEYTAIGGQDTEDDDLFRKRIKEEVNILSRNTQSYLTSALRKINPNVLRIFNQGLDNTGNLQIGIATVNGASLSSPELNDLLIKGEKYFSLNELKPDGLNNYGIVFVNVSYYFIDTSFRAEISASYNADDVRKEIQINLQKRFDHRFWDSSKNIVDWVDMLQTVRNTPGVVRAIDNYFFPNVDIVIPRGQLPRMRGFIMMDYAGNIITNISNTLNPLYYPVEADFSFTASVLKSI